MTDSARTARTVSVEKAAAILGISRSVAYRMANDYLASGGAEGIPVLRLGKRLVVPTVRLDLLLEGKGPSEAVVAAAAGASGRVVKKGRRDANRSS